MARLFSYPTYSFIDKDPVIDTLRTQLTRRKVTIKDLSAASGVSQGTIRNWFYGETRRPSHATVKAVAIALGFTYTLTRKGKK